MSFTTASQMHAPDWQMLMPAPTTYAAPVAALPGDTSAETLTVYYSPVASTEVAKYLGFGLAYHMTILYTDTAGRNFAASARPSNWGQVNPKDAFDAILYMADNQPSSFGTLIADTNNNKAFAKGGAGDYFTHDAKGHEFPHAVLQRGKDLSAQWASIVQTYTTVGNLGLTYSPMSQNSNSVAATALRRAHIGLGFSSDTYFTPGSFTLMAEDLTKAKA